MYCFGCDIDVPKTNDRRSLDSPEAEYVVIVWRAFLDDEDQLISVDVDVDVILNGGDSKRQSKMCGKCSLAASVIHSQTKLVRFMKIIR